MRGPDAQRAGFFHARISACAAVASLHLRVVSMKEHKHWKQAMQFLEIKMAAGWLGIRTALPVMPLLLL
jgi:hypothetical protein